MDYVSFKPEDEDIVHGLDLPVYKILIVDDEEEVHKITRLILRELKLDGRQMDMYSAYSLAEGKRIFNAHEDIAVVLIDVVMETNNAGLDLVRYIRETLNNRTTRIILRTGQPGAAPEEKVIIDYDINDYKSKTELTSQRLITSIVACIRSYRDIVMIDRNRQGLRRIIDASSQLFDYHDKSTHEFLEGMLTQLVLFHYFSGEQGEIDGFVMIQNDKEFKVAAATGVYKQDMNHKLWELKDTEVVTAIHGVCSDNREKLIFGGDYYLSYHAGFEKVVSTIYIRSACSIEEDLMRIFMANIIQALDNFVLNRSILVTEREVISTLSEIVEKRDMSTANHIKRVSEYAFVLGNRIGMDQETCNNLKIACMMHDVGKIGISDHILLKPASLTSEEFDMIKEHSKIGHRILVNSSLSLMKMAAEIALGHHERWDGTGYPHELKETNIPITARMISVLDVFDALTHKRIYKGPWAVEEAFAFIKEQRGKMFDPQMVDLFFESIDQIMAVWHEYPD